MLVPGIMLVLAVMSINIFGDGVRDALDPRAKVQDRPLMPTLRAAAMIRFIIRRLFATVFVIIAVTIITFLLLAATGNQAARLAGKNATAAQIHQIAVQYGFDKPIYVQYFKTMKNIFTGQAYSYTQGINVLQEVGHDFPATLSLAFGAGIIWLMISILLGTLAAVYAGRYTDRVLTILSMAGVSFPPFFLGAIFLYFLGYKLNWFPLGGYVKLTSDPWQWFVHLVLPWVDAVDPVHRLLLAGAAIDDPRQHQRGLRPHRPRQGPDRPPGAAPPHAAQLADPDHLAVGPGHGPGDRRRRDPDRVGVQPARRRPAGGDRDRRTST